MAIADLTNTPEQIISGKDNIVVRNVLETIRGGRTLDVTGYPHDILNAGHVIIKSDTGEFKPFPLNVAGTAYGTLPADHTIVGILIATVPTKRPFAGILIRGSVNPNAAPFDMATILASVKTALPLVTFLPD